ncbi:autotransporter outer membrane beta-barrel domain-containing protein [Ereboglobus sp. PH5-10]|uniref:autotransporter outer membrane beta-barrel domain-containing protein n=1 Tax=Ereboglobus sp. PH5-10 TaxID=2940629 RepID=UPI00240713DB|nr:autotransporter outer membrane beta-barrel domain-containing protein [Ereboglobus sp. PH5-10]
MPAADVYWGGGEGYITDGYNWYADSSLTITATRKPEDVINIASGTVRIISTSTVNDTNIGLGSGDEAAVIVAGLWNNTTGELSIGNGLGSKGSLSIIESGSVRASTFYVGNYGSGTFYLGENATLYNSANAWFARNIGGSGTATIDGNWNVGGYMIVGNMGESPTVNDGSLLTINESGTVSIANYIRIGNSINSSGTVIVHGLLRTNGTNAINSIGYTGTNSSNPAYKNATGVLIIGQTGTVIFSGTETSLGHIGLPSGADHTTNASGTVLVDGVWQMTGGNLKVGRSGVGYLKINETGTVTVSTFLTIADGNSAFNANHTVPGASSTAIVNGYLGVGTSITVANSGVGSLTINDTGTVSIGSSMSIGAKPTGTGTVIVGGQLDVGTNIVVGGSGNGTLEIINGGTVIAHGTNNYVGTATTGTTGHGTIIIRSGGYLDTGTRNSEPNANFGIGWGGTGTMFIEAGGTAVSSGFGGETTAFSLGNNATGDGIATIAGRLIVNNGYTAIGLAGTGTLEIVSGGLVTADRVLIASGNASVGTLLLNGGMLEANQFVLGAGSATIMATGGTLRARTDTDDFFKNFSNLDIGSGTLALDTQALAVTATNAFAGTSDASLIKLGSGSLALTADSTAFSGTIAVRAGSIVLAADPNTSIGAKLGNVYVDNGGRISATAADATVAELTIASGGSLDMCSGAFTADNITLENGAIWRYSLTGTHALDVSGTLVFGGGGSFIFDRDTLEIDDIVPGSYTLATYTAISGTDFLSSWAITGVDFGLTADAVLDIMSVPGTLKINIGSAGLDFLYWKGGDDVWDTDSITWTRTSTSGVVTTAAWKNGALAVFATGTGTIDVSGFRSAFGLQFDDVVYTINGTGTLAAVAENLAVNTTVATGTAFINAVIETPILTKTGLGTLNIGGNATVVNSTIVDAGALEVAATGTLNTGKINIASAADSEVYVTVAGVVENTGILSIANDASATALFAVEAGGTVSSSDVIYIGAQGTATATVAGYLGSGSDTHIGFNASSQGSVSVSQDAVFETRGSLTVGNEGSALLDIANGGTVQAGANFVIANAVGSSGTVNVDGMLVANALPYVGAAGYGELNINSGTVVNNNGTLYLGGGADGASSGTGVINVTNNGFLDNTGKTMVVGRYGVGSVTIETGGSIASGNLYISDTSTANGGITIKNGARWDAGVTYVAQRGTGALAIEQGGELVSLGGANIANTAESDANGTVTVAGLWDATGGNFQIGVNGVGTLIIEQTGTVLAGGTDNYVLLGRYAAGSGTAIVRGFLDTGTRGHASNANFGIGWDGAGYMSIEQTGTVIASGTGENTAGFVIGAGATGSGTLDLAGYLAVNNGDALVSKDGVATLNIASTGTMLVGGHYKQNHNSTLTVDLASSRTDAYITAGKASLSGTLVLNGASFGYNTVTKASELSDLGALIVTASNGIYGNFTSIIGIPGGTTPDYITMGGQARDEADGTSSYYAGYRLAWNAMSGAHGTFTINEGETFEVDTPLANRVADVDPSWDKRSLTKLGTGTLILSGSNSFTGALNIAEGTVQLGGPVEHRYGQLANHGVLNIGNIASDDYRSVEVKGLSGNGSVLMNVNPGTGESDRLIVNGDAEGTHNLVLGAAASSIAPTSDSPAPVLATISGENNATFTGGLDFEGTNYAVVQSAPGTIILATNGQSDAFSAISSVHGAQSVMWFASQDNLYRRIGELRSISEEPSGKYSVWLRARAENSSFSSSTNMRPFEMDLYGFEIGADKTIAALSGRMALGVYLGYGHASQDFDARNGSADGDSDQLSLGAYAAWMNTEGWFANATLTGALYDNEFTSTAQNGSTPTKGSYDDTAIGLSLEVGKRIALDQKIGAGWFAEPSTQLSLVYLMRDDYTTKGDNLAVDSDDATIARLRATLRAGRAWKLANSHIEIAGRIGAAYEDSSGGKIRVNDGTPWRPNVDGARGEAGVGLIWRPTAAGQLYFDYEFATGEGYQKPWSISLGYRHAF